MSDLRPPLDTAKRTPWFPQGTKPIRKGYYECHICCVGRGKRGTTHHWNGAIWRFSNKPYLSVLDPDFKWRGLAKKPRP